MALLNPTFEQPGAGMGTALHWTLQSFCGAQRIAAFGPTPIRAVEDFERWTSFEEELNSATSVRAFFEKMSRGMEGFRWGHVLISELETSCEAALFDGSSTENMEDGWLGYPCIKDWNAVHSLPGNPETFASGWRSNELYAWWWSDVSQVSAVFDTRSVERFAWQ